MKKEIALGAAAAVLSFGAVFGLGQAHADYDGYGTDNDETYEMGACANLSKLIGASPSETVERLLNGNKHTAMNPNGHITRAQAEAIVAAALAQGCQNVGGS